MSAALFAILLSKNITQIPRPNETAFMMSLWKSWKTGFSATTSVEDAFDANEVALIIDGFLETLKKEDRIIFVRRYWFSDSIPDIAELFLTSNHNVSVRLSRIRQKLKKYLIKEGVSL